jgi:hypothetical protein
MKFTTLMQRTAEVRLKLFIEIRELANGAHPAAKPDCPAIFKRARREIMGVIIAF